MTKTLIDIDVELLRQAQSVLDVTTKKDAVNGSLQELRRMAAVREFLMSVGGHGEEQGAGGLVLVDASVLTHCFRPEVAAQLVPLLVMDRVATCAAVVHETAGLTDDAATYAPLAALHEARLRWLSTDDDDLRRAAEIQAQLSSQGQPRLSWSRLVIATVAQRHGVSLLHYTGDYDLIAKVTEQPAGWIVPAGTLPERPSQ